MNQFNKLLKTFVAISFASTLLMATACHRVDNASISNDKKLTLPSSLKKGELSNGMTYYLQENAEPKNRIQLRLVVKAGSCLEDDDQKGIAHFIEHLCFNGTKNFAKSAIVDYFEKIGMQFGPEVNAYTGFEETVYSLELPADDPEILRTSLLVLHDWACNVSFEPEEIEKERGVIIEEWRARTQNIHGRITDKTTSLLLKDSHYAKRLPIGDMDIIKNISRERIMDFYKRWYRPNLMSIVAIGDIKTDVLKTSITEIMGTIPASDEKHELTKYEIPIQTKKTINIMKDKELLANEVYIMQQSEDNNPITTAGQIREQFALDFAAIIMNQRFAEITNKPDAKWLRANIGSIKSTNKNTVYYLSFIPKDGNFTQAFKAFLDEFERFMNFGITETELKRMKQSSLQTLQQDYQNKDHHPSNDYANKVVKHILTGQIYISEEDALKISTQIINSITKEEILEKAKMIFKDRGTIMQILSPESFSIPDEKEIMDIWKNYESQSAKQAYVDNLQDDSLMQKPAKKAKITEKKVLKELDATQYNFENGVKIITKKTDFQKDSIEIYAGSKGGTFLLDEKDVPSADVSLLYEILSGTGGKDFSQIQKIANSKNMLLNINLDFTQESFTGRANENNIEETLQLINLLFTKPQFTEKGWNTLINQYAQLAETYDSQPFQVYSDEIKRILFGKNEYYAPKNKEWLSKLNPETSERVFNERFSNPADFTFVFIGDFNEKNLVDLCAYYLGTLKTNDKFDETKYVYFPFPSRSETMTVKKGIDKTGYVYLAFGGNLPENNDIEQNFKESTIINQLTSMLEIRLREVIREDKSGSYGIQANGLIDGWPERFYQVEVQFGCEPTREEELKDSVIETIKDIQNGNISDDLIAKLKETYIRELETSLRNNSWWLGRISSEIIFSYEPLWYTKDCKETSDWITKEALVEAANKYLDTEKFVTVYLKPEK